MLIGINGLSDQHIDKPDLTAKLVYKSAHQEHS